MRATLAAALGALGVAVIAVAPARAQPVFSNVTVHDPSVVRVGSTYYVFGSHLASASTTDLMNWTQISSSPAAGNPLAPNASMEFAEALTWVGSTTFWAPDVIRLGDGRFYFYYCIGRLDQPRAALGLAVSNSITGPYTNQGILLRSGMFGLPSEDGTIYDATVHPNTVDPAVFLDQTGNLWMVYGSYSGGVFILRMDPVTGRQMPGQGYGKKLIGGNHARIEGAYIIYSPESEYYYLFLSFGGLDASGGYNIRLGRSRNPDGPYLDAAGTDLVSVRGAPGTLFDDASIVPHGVKLMGGYQFLHAAGEPGSTSRGYVSPGHNSAYYDSTTGKYLLFFHTRFVGRGEIHEVRVHQMFVNADDWLVVAPHRYTQETISATNVSEIPGAYKMINHGKAITATVSPSTTISLLANGSITGASTGTWQWSGDYDVTLTLAGTIYRGVFVRQWDDDSQRSVLTFSALSANGVAVWGSKLAIAAAPVILTQPAAQTVMAGASATLSVAVTGDPGPTYQWLKSGVDISGATESSFTIAKAAAGNAGPYSVRVVNSVGTVTSNVVAITVNTPPLITVHPASVTQIAGTSARLAVTASGSGALSYQWSRDGVALAEATASILDLPALQFADAGDYAVLVTDSVASGTSRMARVVVDTPVAGRITNMSVRSTAGVDGHPLIVGFVMSGGSKEVLLRGIGPTLANFNVTGVMADPALTVHAKIDSVDTILGANDNWGDGGQAPTLAAAFMRLFAFPLPDMASKDAALLTPVDGSRTVHANNAASGPRGVVLVEVYDSGVGNAPRLVNVSARNFAGRDSETLIAGFVIGGNVPKRVLVRGVGPTLADYDVSGSMADPKLELHTTINRQDRIVATNDDWADEPGVAAISAAVFGFPLRPQSTDAAIVVILPAGSYTAVVSGVNNVTGEALVEVYEVP